MFVVLRSSLITFALSATASAQVGTVQYEAKISETAGGFGGDLDPSDYFGSSAAGLGDLDGDGVLDLALGAPRDDDGGTDQGAVWILFLNADGTVKAEQKISATSGGFGGDLDPSDRFGESLAALGDLDGDGFEDLAAGANLDDDGSTNAGALWVLFLNADGTVKTEQKISATAGGFGGSLTSSDSFGSSVACIGDLDGDGVEDLAVGASQDSSSGIGSNGALWILFLQADGTVAAEQEISPLAGGFGGVLDPFDFFGDSVAALGDVDGDGVIDLAVGAPFTDDGGSFGEGAVWILFLESDGTVAAEQKISATSGGIGFPPHGLGEFGDALAPLGDLNEDGVPDLAVGASGEGVTDVAQGAVRILFLNPDGTVAEDFRITAMVGGFGGDLGVFDQLGTSVASLGDVDGDGVLDLAAGAIRDDDGGFDQGAAWLLFLEGPPPDVTLDFETEDDFASPLVNGQHIDTEFGVLVTLTSSGSNAGLATFASGVGGPNDPSQDLDLLVGTGNLLVLQTENFPPDANDVFPRPNDDDGGGTVRFQFVHPAEPRSLRLIDVDAADGPTGVVLTDGEGRERTYTVPGDWTGDRMLGQPGHGLLDLATLAEQPGFASTATVVEAPGFEPRGVVQLEVRWDGSGALDDLTFCSASLPRAALRTRNGSGLNPRLLAAAMPPRLGSTWSVDLDCSGFGSGFALLEVRRLRALGTSPYGEVLIGGALLHRAMGVFSSATSRLAWTLPRTLDLWGLEVHVQGLCRGRAPSSSSWRALPARVRLTNALDLVLGF